MVKFLDDNHFAAYFEECKYRDSEEVESFFANLPFYSLKQKDEEEAMWAANPYEDMEWYPEEDVCPGCGVWIDHNPPQPEDGAPYVENPLVEDPFLIIF